MNEPCLVAALGGRIQGAYWRQPLPGACRLGVPGRPKLSHPPQPTLFIMSRAGARSRHDPGTRSSVCAGWGGPSLASQPLWSPGILRMSRCESRCASSSAGAPG